jgi:two-component system sensor histidine kinase YesM
MKNVRFIGSFRFKLILLLFLIVLIPISALSFLLTTWINDIMRSKFSDTALQSIRQCTRNIDFTLNDLRNHSNIILTNRHFINLLKDKKSAGPNEIENMVRGFFTSGQNISGIYIYSGADSYSIGSVKEITVYAAASWYSMLMSSDGEVRWISTRRETAKILCGSVDKYVFSLGRRLVDIITLEKLGVLMIDVDESVLEESYRGQIIADDVEAFICDGEGKIVSHTDKERIGKSAMEVPYVKMVLESETSDGRFIYKDDYMNVMTLYSTSELTGWKLITVIPSGYLYREVNAVRSIFLMACVAITFLLFVIILFLSNKLTKPMRQLMETMNQAENGNLNVKIDIKRMDEIGQLGICFNSMISKIKALMEKNIREEKLKKEIELEALHAQINPHFLYNTLNSIKWMAKMQGANNISNTITALVKLLRISINLSSEMIYLKDEIEHVRNYVFIQKIRFNEQIEVSYDIDRSCLECRVPKLILQPIVENSIVHGLMEEDGELLNIEIRARRDGKNLLLEVNDDGVGIEEAALHRIFEAGKANKFSTVGLNNVNDRIRLYFGEGYGIKITSEVKKGTHVLITLPFIENEGGRPDVQSNDCR